MSNETPPRSWLGRVGSTLRDLGSEAMQFAGLNAQEEPQAPTEEHAEANDRVAESKQRFSVMQGVANQLRGAADGYLAAKLDEVEARVDLKLDEIDARIDDKIANLIRQLEEVRDRELRHRLRILKFTLLFTVLVAVVSLAYKWASQLPAFAEPVAHG